MSSALTALGIVVAYIALVTVLWKLLRVDYEHIADTRSDAVRGLLIPIGLGALLLVVAVTALGWWGPAMTEPERVGPSWALAVPAIMAVAVVLAIASIDFGSPGVKVLPLILLGTALVGFSEEMLVRGQLLVGLRESGVSEWAVVGISCLVFGLLHAVNALFGQSLQKTVVQVLYAAIMGVAFYVTRMSTGMLVVCMVLHALWDFGSLGVAATRSTVKPAAPLTLYLALAVSLVAVFFIA